MSRLIPGLVLVLVSCSYEAPHAIETPAASANVAVFPSDTASAVASGGELPTLALELVTSGLELPANITAGSDGSLYVNEVRAGRIRVVDGEGNLRPHAFVDLSDRSWGYGERGLLGLAFHPEYDSNGRLFVHYTRVGDGATVVSELARTADGASADPASERILLTVEHPAVINEGIHNGGQLEFGPDGYLYVAIGDGGSVGDVLRMAQNPEKLLGKILRIDVDGDPGAGMSYAIPSDNPFVDAGGAPEVYVLGLRNPWRFSFDPASDALWIADVGETAWEEVDRLEPDIAPGANLGWNVMEANHCFRGETCDKGTLVPPLVEYGRDSGCAVTGGYVYRGQMIPDLVGWYLFADYCSGLLFGVSATAEPAPGEVVEPRLLLATELSISTFGRGSDGELFVADILGGAIYRIVASQLD